MTPVVSAFLCAADGVASLQKKEYKEATIKFLEAATIGALDVVTLGVATKTKLIYKAGRETLRAASAMRASKEPVSQLLNMASNSSDIVRTYGYTAGGMIRNLIRKIVGRTETSVDNGYDNIQLRRLIAASALEDMNIVDQERQQQLLNVLEEKFEEISTDSEEFSATDLLTALNAILESESYTAVDEKFNNLYMV